eukprot:COSAG02_NODE_2728_length_8148_cov_19.461921_5_plen_62_part_00
MFWHQGTLMKRVLSWLYYRLRARRVRRSAICHGRAWSSFCVSPSCPHASLLRQESRSTSKW